MRTQTTGNVTITYPNYICPIFSPCLVEMEGLSGEVAISLTSGKVTYIDIRHPYNGKASIDIASYLHAFFPNDGKTYTKQKNVTMSITLKESSDVVLSASFLAVYAVAHNLAIPIRQRMYANYPTQTASFLVGEGGGVVDIGTHQLNSPAGYREVRLQQYWLPTRNTRNVVVGDITYPFILDKSECGQMFKWIDAQGYTRHFLFQEGEKTTTTKDNGDALSRYCTIATPMGEYYGEMSQPQGVEFAISRKYCATFCDEADRELISTIYGALFVWVVDKEGNETPVTIKRGGVTTKKGLQDFEIEVNLPSPKTMKI